MEYEIQYARITTTGKIPDRFLNCQSKESADLAKVYMGTVYTLVEIISPWFTTSQVGQSIINTFSQVYYAGTSTSDLDNFEEALKKVNENLAQITQNGETNWIGNLNAILAVQIENKIHLAQTGAAEAYIFREGKTNHLTYGLSQGQTDTHPLKTFSNITSGELKPHDKVLIANPDLIKNLNLDALREIISFHTPSEAVLQIAKILKKKKVRAVNVLILELLTLEEASKQTPNNLSDNIHLDRPIESYGVYFEKFWIYILRPILSFMARNLKKAGVKLLNLTKTYIQKIKDRRAAEPIKDDKFNKEFLTEGPTDEGLLKDEEIEYSPELNVHYYEQAKNKKEDKVGQIWSLVSSKISLFAKWLVGIWQNKKTRPYLLIFLAVIVILILIFAIGGKKHTESSKLTLLQAQTILKNAQASQGQAKTAALTNDNETAKLKYNDCVSLTQQITSIDMLKTDTVDVNAQCQGELDKLTSTTRFKTLNPIASVPNIKTSFVVGGQVILVGSGEVYKSTITGGKPEKVATLPRNNGDFQFGTVSGQSIYLYTSTQKFYEYNLDTNNLVLSKISGAWPTANAASFYTGTLYLIDGIVGQIYKHTSDQNSFSAGQNYIDPNAVDVKNGISIAVDGSIYVLRSSGDALKLQKGKLQDFSLRDVPTPNPKIEKPIKIYTDADTTSIYVLDAGANRVVEFDKDGRFVHQYALPSTFNNLSDLDVSVKAKKIWVLNAGSLYEISI